MKQSKLIGGEKASTVHLRVERWESPMCPLLIVTDEDGVLRALEFGDHETRLHRLLKSQYEDYSLLKGNAPDSLKRALRAYFDGDIEALNRIETATGGTAFQREVWKALRTI